LRYPFGCDESFDAAFIIGQHAMSNADGGHLAHTGGFNVENQTLNGQEVGELAVNMLMCAYFGVPTVFLAGDQACCEEVRRLIPSIETVAVKAGDKRGSASGLSLEENRLFNSAAIHLAPTHARELIRDGARRALLRRHEIPKFWVEPPYEWTMTLRPEADSPALRAVANHSDFMALLEAPKNFEKVA
jgi:D-amino peptidase